MERTPRAARARCGKIEVLRGPNMLKIIACDDDVAFLDNLHRMVNRWSAETGTAVDVALVTRGEECWHAMPHRAPTLSCST